MIEPSACDDNESQQPSPRSELGVVLDHALLQCRQPDECAAFYSRVFEMNSTQLDECWLCVGDERRILLSHGPSNRLGFAAFAFADPTALEGYRARLSRDLPIRTNPSPLCPGEGFAIDDPDGNRLAFFVRREEVGEVEPECEGRLQGRLQHLALRSHDPAALASFYREVLGFLVSDRVCDHSGRLRACFLRTNREHHAIAIFDAAETGHDHLSIETANWANLKRWADHVVQQRERIVWGIGRHGPGNDAFFMVRDPDGNLAEVSTELEECEADRPEGAWLHEDRTFNLWGGSPIRV